MEGDKRFAHIATDRKFRRIPKGERKVKIDNRFKSMFNDKQFKVKYTVDKRGRPVSHSTTEDLKRYYDLDSADDEDSEQESSETDQEAGRLETCTQTKKKGKQVNILQPDDSNDDDDDAEHGVSRESPTTTKADRKISDKVKKKLKNLTVDYARGEGQLFSDSSSDDDAQTDDEDVAIGAEPGIDHKWGELDGDADRTEDATHRLAACNMDWDRIKATDLMVLFNSFLPPGGSIKSVVIYPSEFGKQRMAEEMIKGPAELIQPRSEDDDDNDDEGNEDGSKYHMEKLRQYQLNRLKYYYAVITFDGPNSANKIYAECDGMEYESSATKIDLRFIPDSLSFDDDAPKESCTQLPELAKYKPRFFTTTALQQAKVDLTWDETNPDRIEITQKLASGKIDDIDDCDLQAYLASSSDEESDAKDDGKVSSDSDSQDEDGASINPIDKYKLLLQEIDAKDKAKEKKEIGMEITWGIDLQKKTDKLMKEKKAALESKTPFQEFLDKRKEKRKEKRAAKKEGATNKDDDDDDSDMPSDIDMHDPYFAEEFDKPEFKQKAKNRSQAKGKGRKEDNDNGSDSAAESKAQLELLLNDDDDGKQHFSLKKIQDQENESKSKKKRKGKKEKGGGGEHTTGKPDDEFQLNVNDERFSALFTSHHYNIDPTDPHFKKTKNMEKLISEKIKRRTDNESNGLIVHKKAKSENKTKANAELNVLVKSVKRKAQAFSKKK